MKRLLIAMVVALIPMHVFGQVPITGTPGTGWVPYSTSSTTAKWVKTQPIPFSVFGAVCDGTTNDLVAINAALAYVLTAGGGRLTGNDQTCAVSGDIVLPNTSIWIEHVTFKQLAPNVLDRATINADSHTAGPIALVNVTLNRNGAPTDGGDTDHTYGIRLRGDTVSGAKIPGIYLQNVEVYGDGIGVGIRVELADGITDSNSHVHDMRWQSNSDPGIERIVGIWYVRSSNGVITNPRVERLLGSVASGGVGQNPAPGTAVVTGSIDGPTKTLTVTAEAARANINGSISGTTLTVNSVSSGTVAVGQIIVSANTREGTQIVGGSGTTWTVSSQFSQTVASENMILTNIAIGQTVEAGGTQFGKIVGRKNSTANSYLLDATTTLTSQTLSLRNWRAYQTDGFDFSNSENFTVTNYVSSQVSEGSDTSGGGTNRNLWWFGSTYTDIGAICEKMVHNPVNTGSVGTRCTRAGLSALAFASANTTPGDVLGITNIKIIGFLGLDVGNIDWWRWNRSTSGLWHSDAAGTAIGRNVHCYDCSMIGRTATVTGSISGNVLTVDGPDYYRNGEVVVGQSVQTVSGGGVKVGTYITAAGPAPYTWYVNNAQSFGSTTLIMSSQMNNAIANWPGVSDTIVQATNFYTSGATGSAYSGVDVGVTQYNLDGSRNIYGDLTIGKATTGASYRYTTFDVSNGGMISRYDDNGVPNLLRMENYGIVASGQGAGVRVALGKGHAVLQTAGALSLITIGDWQTGAASQTAKWVLTVPNGAGATVTSAQFLSGGILSEGYIGTGGSNLTLSGNAIGIRGMTPSGVAPGAAGGKMELVCGSNPGTAKLQITAGTSATPVTIVNNIGAGVSGC